MLHPEQIDHINYLNWFKETYPDLKDDIHHFANERKTSQMQGKILKRMGVVAGVYDIFLAFPWVDYNGFWLELKVGKNKLSPQQKAFALQKIKRGYWCAEAWGFDAAKAATELYLSGYNTICI
jgi:hypothetical protein